MTKKKAASQEMDPGFAPVLAAFAATKNVTYGPLMSSFGLKVNGRIFAMVVRGDLVVKLSASRVDELASARHGRRFEPSRGRVMKEWIVVKPGAMDWVALAREAHRFVSRQGSTE